jgi:hypothetical protein
MSPAPKAPATANIDTHVNAPTQVSLPVYQPPALPSFLDGGLIPSFTGYTPAPSMPGYAMPRTGHPFAPTPAAQNAPLLPGFNNPFVGAAGGGGGIAYGVGGAIAGTGYDPSDPTGLGALYGQLLVPKITPQV